MEKSKRPLAESLHEFFKRLEESYEGVWPSGAAGQTCGVQRLASMLIREQLAVLAGRPCSGKTTLALSLASDFGFRGHPVLYFSLQTEARELAARLVAQKARLPWGSVRTGQLLDHQWPMLTRAAGLAADLPLTIEDTPRLTAREIADRACDLLGEEAWALIVVDDLSLIASGAPAAADGADGARERSQALQVLRETAQYLGVPILLLVELGPGVEARADNRPVAQDLAEVGVLEREADVVLYLHRPGMYEQRRKTKGVVDVKVARHPASAFGTVRLTFLEEETRFLDPEERPADVTLN